jgi:site-specific DNA-methyltransferase (cytosine-N4-specific)
VHANDAAKMVAYRKRLELRERVEGSMFAIFPWGAHDTLRLLDAQSVDVCVTSPPYWRQREYGMPNEMGLETTPEEWAKSMTALFREVHCVLRPRGTLWVNVGQTTAQNRRRGPLRFGNPAFRRPHHKNIILPARRVPPGYKLKDVIDLADLLIEPMRRDGWYHRQTFIWHKPNPRPNSQKDRLAEDYESILLFAKSRTYDFDRNAAGPLRSTWSIKVGGPRLPLGSKGHPAPFPLEIPTRCIKLANCPIGGTVLDPFCGNGTTGLAALKHRATFIGIEINPEVAKVADGMLRDYLDGVIPKPAAKADDLPSPGDGHP